MEMIKSVLQKVIDEMNGLESDRIMPEHKKPKMMAAKVETVAAPEEMAMDEEESELDPEILSQLMQKADGADENGASEEDRLEEFDPEISEAIKRKKGMK